MLKALAKGLTTTTSLVLLLVTLIALIVVTNATLRGARLDLTENNLYTVSDGTRDILSELDEPINLYFFLSEDTSRAFPGIRRYAKRVEETLEELSLYAGGTLKLTKIDPEPFSEAEDRAAQFGLQAVSVGAGGETLYFGLAGTNAIDGQEVIPFFQPDREPFLEYDLAKLIHSLSEPEKPVIGLVSGLPITRGFDVQTRQVREPWVVTEQAQQLFDVRDLGLEFTTIDPDVDLLWIVHPQGLSEQALYAVDQFLMRGGRALAFLDPHAEQQETPENPSNPMAAAMADRSSDLGALLEPWGVDLVDDEIIGDRRYALDVSTGRGAQPVRHFGILGIDQSGMNQEDIVSARLDEVILSSAGHLEVAEDAAVTAEPLLQSSTEAMPIPAEQLRFLRDPSQLSEGFEPTGERYLLAARLTGVVPSAFPDGPPGTESTDQASADEAAPETGGGSADADSPTRGEDLSPVDHLSESEGSINLVLVADTDVLSDRLWVQTQDFFGRRIATAFSNNGDLVANALDNLSGSAELISIRARSSSERPFTRVETLERAAQARLAETENRLKAELADTEAKLAQLQATRQDGNRLTLTPEQQAEIERFRDEQLRIRQELRQVRLELDQDIERLGTVMRVINIGLMPMLVTLLAVALVLLRGRRRKAAKARFAVGPGA